MRDDVVELPEIRGDVQDVPLLQLDVGEPERRGEPAPELDRPRRELDAEKTCLGKPAGHGNEVLAGAATELQHAAALDRGRLQAEQPCIGGDPVRMRVLPRGAGIMDAVLEG